MYRGGSSDVPAANIAAIRRASGSVASSPDRGGTAGPVTVVLQGYGCQSGAGSSWCAQASADIVGSPVKADQRQPRGHIRLERHTLGGWDIVVTNVDASFGILRRRVHDRAAAGPQLRVDIIGSALIRARAGARRTTIVIDNPGNVDAVARAAVDHGRAHRCHARARLPAHRAASGRGRARLVDRCRSPSRAPAGAMHRSSSRASRPALPCAASTSPFLRPTRRSCSAPALTPPWVDGNKFRACLANGGISDPGVHGGSAHRDQCLPRRHPGIDALSGIGVWAKIAWQCESARPLPVSRSRKAEQILDFMVNPHSSPAARRSPRCSDVLPPRWRDSLLVTIVSSLSIPTTSSAPRARCRSSKQSRTRSGSRTRARRRRRRSRSWCPIR